MLIDSTEGPLLAIAPRDGFEDAVLGFEIVGHDDGRATRPSNTNWPRRLSFPNFCLNVLQYLAGGAAESQMQNNRPGRDRSELDLAERATELTVVLPDGSTRDVETPTAGKLVVPRHRPAGRLRSAGRRARWPRDLRSTCSTAHESDVRLAPGRTSETGLQDGRVAVDRLHRRGGRVAVVAVRRSCGSGCCWRHWPCWSWSGISIIAGVCVEAILAAMRLPWRRSARWRSGDLAAGGCSSAQSQHRSQGDGNAKTLEARQDAATAKGAQGKRCSG